LKFSTLTSAGWDAKPRTVARGTDWFVNWADFPAVEPIDATHWSAHWLVKRPGGDYAYDVVLSVSADGGGSWKPAFTPHLDGTLTEHGFVSKFPVAGGLAVAWLDGRETSGAADHEAHGAANEGSAETSRGAMTLRAARVALDGTLGEQFLVDPRVCDCCQTASAVTKRGALLAYRDRSEGELRDISVARFENGEWRKLAGPRSDGWKIDGCPVNGPALDANGDNIALAWFTAAENNRPRVMLALSHDAGDAFGEPIIVDENVLGRVDVVALDDGGAVVSWLAQTGQGAEIRLMRVADGEKSPIRTVAATQPARSSGFPQLARRGDDLVLAWTVVGEPSSVRVAMLKGGAR
jgi:hypothetical protein